MPSGAVVQPTAMMMRAGLRPPSTSQKLRAERIALALSLTTMLVLTFMLTLMLTQMLMLALALALALALLLNLTLVQMTTMMQTPKVVMNANQGASSTDNDAVSRPGMACSSGSTRCRHDQLGHHQQNNMTSCRCGAASLP